MSLALVIATLGACRKGDPEANARPADTRPANDAVAAAGPVTDRPTIVPDRPGFDVRAHLAAATEVVLYGITPERALRRTGIPTATDFHDFPILKTIAVPAVDTAAVASAVRDGIGQVPLAYVPACFDPHHGLRVTTTMGTVDLVICFQCSQVHVYQGATKVAWATMGRDAETVLARYLGETPEFGESWR